jgi:hypothetical protein
MYPLGTVAFGTSSFPHKVVLSMKSYEDSGESMKNGWIVAPGVSSVLLMIVRGLRCMMGPHSHLASIFIPLRIGCAAHHPVRRYLPTYVGVGGFHDHRSLSRAVVGRRRAGAPALPHCGAGGSMTNVRGRDGTSDGAGRRQFGTMCPPWRHCRCVRSANECHPEALANAAAPSGARERLFS